MRKTQLTYIDENQTKQGLSGFNLFMDPVNLPTFVGKVAFANVLGGFF